MNIDELKAKVSQYTWYHNTDLGNGVVTPGHGFHLIWGFIKKNLALLDFEDKYVLDIGCRDCMFAFQAERAKARAVVAFDNDLSLAAKEFLIPYFQSRVQLHKMNVYELTPATFGEFDITMMLGVLYHLRYPFNGLRAAVKATKFGGLIAIETAVLKGLQEIPLVYCPWKEGNPYEPGSISYFNESGLTTAMESFGCSLVCSDSLDGSDVFPGKPNHVRRGFFLFRRSGEMSGQLQNYWEGCHSEHSKAP
jgi:tRNA (mo5U34)-methyltransferase